MIISAINERKRIYQSVSDILEKYRKAFLVLLIFQFFFLIGAMLGPYLYGLLIDEVMIKKKMGYLVWICVGYVGIYCFESVLNVFHKRTSVLAYNSMKLDLRKKMWSQYMKAPFAFIEKKGNGDLKQRIDTDINAFETFMNEQVIVYIYNAVSLLFYLVVIVWISWKLSLFGLLMVPVAFWMTKRMAHGSRKAWGAYRDDYGKYENWLQRSLQNWKEIKVLNARENQIEMFNVHWERLKKNFYKGCLYFFVNRSFIGFSDFFITKMNLYFIGGLLIFSGDLRVGLLFVFIKYYEKFYASVTEITNANMKLVEYKESLNRVSEVIDIEFEEGGKKEAVLKKGNICFENVCFKYTEEQKNILQDVNLNIDDKQCVAIVGRSGIGKTTILKLLVGLYENYTGNIYVDGMNIKELSSASLHSHIAVVMQDSILYNGTIINNMRMIKEDVTIEEIQKVCKLANIHDDIMQMPKEYETVIGEKGMRLSGGQKQRLSIARALLSTPRILILDEATSALDSDSETKIHDVLKILKCECTVIIIAHRLQSVLLADKVVVMDKAGIVQQGHYSELLHENGEFGDLFRKQYEIR